jgi:hypothetical protein
MPDTATSPVFDWDGVAAWRRDAWIHENVFGEQLPSKAEMLIEAERVWKKQPHCRHFAMGFSAWRDDGEFVYEHIVPRYTTNPAATVQVFAAMTGKGFHMSLDSFAGGDIWHVSILRGMPAKTVADVSGEFSPAGCHCAYLALNAEE